MHLIKKISTNWLFYVILYQLGGVIVSIFKAMTKGGMSFHAFVYYLMFYLTFTNAVTVVASAFFLLFEKRLKRYFKSVTITCVAVVFIIGISIFASKTFVPKIVQTVCSPTIAHDVDHNHVLFVAFNVFLSAVILVSYTIIFIYRKLQSDWEKKMYEIESLKRLHMEAKYAALQSKVNPHFLFNTLNTILDLAAKSPKKVERVILSLSDIYRRVLGLPDDQPITIQEETELIKRYLEVEKIRLNERLTYDIAIEPALNHVEIPPLIIQTLVENAIKHGIAPKKEGGHVDINMRQENHSVVFEVIDNGVGIRNAFSDSGFGLSGTKKRLQIFYQDQATFQINKQETGGTKIRITIPHEVESRNR